VEDQVKLADVLEALVKELDEDLDEIEHTKLALALVSDKYKVQRCVAAVDQLRILAPELDAGER